MKTSRREFIRTAALATAAGLSSAAEADVPLEQVKMVVFGQPSLGAFFQPIIKAQKFDQQNGIALEFAERTPDAYILEFNSGEFDVGGSAALLSVGVARNRGIKVSYLFNLFDYFGAVVTDRPEIKSLADLQGKQLVAATASTNFAMFRWLLQKQGISTDKLSVQNTATPGLLGYALADRADAIELWEPAYSQLLSKKPGMRTLDLQIDKQWKTFSNVPTIPYLGVAAHDSWIQKNPAIAAKLYKTFKAAAGYVALNPNEASSLIAASLNASVDMVRAMVTSNKTLSLHVASAQSMRPGIEAVYRAGLESGYFTQAVDTASIYPIDFT